MKRIVLFTGGVETQGFFSLQLEKGLRALGHPTFIFDYATEGSSSYDLLRFYRRGDTVMLSFNFHGICNEELLRDADGTYIWEGLGIPCINIVVDHPFYYDRFMNQLPKDYTQISIDLDHLAYMQRFYPWVKNGPFLPLGGTCLDEELGPSLPIASRDTDLIMTGSWVDPGFYRQYMEQEGPEYSDFYRRVLEKQLQNPHLTFEEVFEPMIRAEAAEGDDITDDALREAYSHLVCFDMYVRYHYRSLVIKSLAEAGLKILCVGGGWDRLPCKKSENITHMEYTDSKTCLELLRRSKISVNVMPWFKKGAHDRIFNSMLACSVCLTDSSEYLDSILQDRTNCLLFPLTDPGEAAEKAINALADPPLLQSIADAGYEMAKKNHTWEKRAEVLSEYIESL